MKKIFLLLLAVISVILQAVAQYSDFFQGTKEIPEDFNKVAVFLLKNIPAEYIPTIKTAAFHFTATTVALAASYLVVEFFAHRHGKKAGPMRHRFLFRQFNPRRLRNLIEQVHKLHHTTNMLKKEIKSLGPLCQYIENDALVGLFKKFLEQARNIIVLMTGSDVAIHIKMFEDVMPSEPNDNPEKYDLVTWIRVNSKHDNAQRKKGQPTRRKSERFKLRLGEDADPKHLSHTFPTTQDDDNCRINSAYCYVFGNNEHFWISNDLHKTIKQGKYYSTSKGWQRYYNSLAVFLIAPPLESGQPVDLRLWGLLIVDSINKGPFDYFLSKFVIGYMAHRLHDLFALREYTAHCAQTSSTDE